MGDLIKGLLHVSTASEASVLPVLQQGLCGPTSRPPTNPGPQTPSRGKKSKQSNLFKERTNIWRAVCWDRGENYSSSFLVFKGLWLWKTPLGKEKALPETVSGQLWSAILGSSQESPSLWRISFWRILRVLFTSQLLTYSCLELVPRPVLFHFHFWVITVLLIRMRLRGLRSAVTAFLQRCEVGLCKQLGCGQSIAFRITQNGF